MLHKGIRFRSTFVVIIVSSPFLKNGFQFLRMTLPSNEVARASAFHFIDSGSWNGLDFVSWRPEKTFFLIATDLDAKVVSENCDHVFFYSPEKLYIRHYINALGSASRGQSSYTLDVTD